MNVGNVAAIVSIIVLQVYFLISETRTALNTTRGMDNSSDMGTLRRIWVLIAIALICAWLVVIFDFGRIFALGGWMTWLGIGLMISGIAFRRYVISYLGNFFTSTVQIQQDHRLIMDGPYRYIRHPSYLGILILCFGNGVALSNLVSLILCTILPAAGIIWRMRVEENKLSRYFGPQYLEYLKRTWRIIPHIY